MAKSKDTTSVQIPKDIHKQLRIEAAQRETTITDLLVQAIKKFLGIK